MEEAYEEKYNKLSGQVKHHFSFIEDVAVALNTLRQDVRTSRSEREILVCQDIIFLTLGFCLEHLNWALEEFGELLDDFQPKPVAIYGKMVSVKEWER